MGCRGIAAAPSSNSQPSRTMHLFDSECSKGGIVAFEIESVFSAMMRIIATFIT